ncbi:MAG: phosphotransferase [SAR202 cluster bacterium]|nr:phosphotransferase [SAR202 cluster bacterium]
MLRNGDIGTGNIIVDSNPTTIVGVIHWGSAGLGDTAVGFAWIRYKSGLGTSFLASLFDTYAMTEAALVRAQFYPDTFMLQEALFGIEHDEVESFRWGMEAYI